MTLSLGPLRVRSLVRLLVIFLLSVLPVATPEAAPAESDSQPAPVNAAGSPAADKTYSVQWDIDATGKLDTQEGGYHVVATRRIRIKGAATVFETSAGASAMPMIHGRLTARWQPSPCPRLSA